MSKYTFGVTYARPKVGKTVAMIKAFPDGLFVAPRGSLLSSSYLGWTPPMLETGPKVGVKQIIEVIKKKSKDYPAIIIDDFSLIADAELAECKRTNQGWSAFDVFNRRIYELRDAARNANCHVFLTMHEQPPREVKKPGQTRWIPGGPLIGGWQLPEKLPAMCDFVARVVYDEDAIGPWKFMYQTGPDPEYITGDRLSVMPERFPLNIREVLLAGGYDVPRPKDLAWMDEAVEKISQELSGELAKEHQNIKPIIAREVERLTEAGCDTHHVRWVVSDALDRAQLREHQSNLLNDFVESF
mgnify:CR=1 FL=1